MGADRETMLLIFQAMIRSSLDYGCFVYGSASKSVLAGLDVLQARALRLCCGAFRTSPVPALLIEMGEMPLWLRRIKLGLQYWVKLSGCHQTFPARCLLQESDGANKYKTFFVNINQWAGRLGLEQVSVAEHTSWLPMPYWVLPEQNIEMVFLQEKDKKLVTPKIAEHLNSIRDSTFIFTDGSRDPVSGRAGFWMHVEQLGVKIGRRISNGSSVFTSEVMAILWALRWIEETRPRELIICSDSAAALEALKGGKSKARPDIITDVF